nr:glycosyltransferase family 39 protein [Variovorax terrae]
MAAWRPLAVPDEGRYGEIGRWMLQSGDWLAPRLNGIPFFHKPPYLYWLEAASLAVFGAQVWAVRLVPALHAGLMLLALYLAGRSIAGERVARRAALMLGTSLAFLIGGQYVNHDMLVAAWIGVAIWCFGLAFMHGERPHANLARLGFVACALGVLSKGLIGLVLPGLALFLWLLWTRQFRKLLYLPWLSGLALFALIAVPWFVLAEQRFPGMLAYLFGTQQFGRYTATTFNNARPWWFYLLCLLVLLFPWVFFALYQAKVQVRRSSDAIVSVASKNGVSLCWIWLAAIIGFFSIPNSKLIGYALPVIPPLALLAALGYERLLGGHRASRAVFAALCALAIGVAVAANVVAGRYSRGTGSLDVAQALACAAAPGDRIYAVGEFPYDLPFYIQAQHPMIVVQDWPELRRSAGDNWRRELFEGADFDAGAAQVLQPPEALAAARGQPGNWVLAPRGVAVDGFARVAQGSRWVLYRSAPAAGTLAPEGPEAAQHKGLPGCDHQGAEQRQQ